MSVRGEVVSLTGCHHSSDAYGILGSSQCLENQCGRRKADIPCSAKGYHASRVCTCNSSGTDDESGHFLLLESAPGKIFLLVVKLLDGLPSSCL